MSEAASSWPEGLAHQAQGLAGGLIGAMRRCPRPHVSEQAAEAPDLGLAAAPLLRGAAGCSPYLLALMRREADWLGPALEAPGAALATEWARMGGLDLAGLPGGLRQAKRRIALIVALADLAGVWPLEAVTGVLTAFADLACDLALRALVAEAEARGRLPPGDGTAGAVLLAMGKMGAHELNYSSDIDLICLFDDARHAGADLSEVRSVLVKLTRRLTAILSEVGPEGYVFRADLRLRPDPSVTPVCLSMSAAEGYYESVGRTWERAAYIKARAAAGDLAAGARFLETLRPFVWRRHLDFAAIQDAHDMRLKIRAHKGLKGPLALEGYDLKLGPGGIREIEFFAQTRQLIAGGRDPGLRERGTVAALEALAGAGWVEDETALALTRHYRAHREMEHRLQMVQDQQTHSLPKSPEGFARLAAMMDRDAGDLRRDVTRRLEAVAALTEAFFDPGPAPAAVDFGTDITARWPDYPALRSDRAQEIFRRVRPEILTELQKAARPEEALAAFDRFSGRSARRRAAVFAV